MNSKKTHSLPLQQLFFPALFPQEASFRFLFPFSFSFPIKMAPKAVPAPESALKGAHHRVAEKTQFKKLVAEKKQGDRELRRKAYLNGLKHFRANRAKQNRLVHLRRQAKQHGNFYNEEKPKVVVVVRIRGLAHIKPKQRKILQLLRLRQIFNARVLKYNRPMANMLRLVEPYIAYGYPSLRTVRDLIYKRGALRVNGQRVKISDNAQVRDKFNNKDVVCVEDVVDQLYNCGPHFRTVSNALWAFKLAPPTGGMRQKRRHFIEGGDYGNRESLINRFVRRMI
jgi:large subunit ribosomal protein L7e